MPALPAIAIGVTVAATAASLEAAAAQSRAQQQAATYNAGMEKYNASILAGQANQDAANISRTGELQMGQARAAAAASGLGDSGSVQDVSYANLVNNEQSALSAKYRGTVESYNAENQSSLDSMEGQNAQTQGYFNEGSSLLNGVSSTYKAYNYGTGSGTVQPIFGNTTTANAPGF